MIKVPSLIEEELKACGVPYEIKDGSKHVKIYLGGRLIAISPKGKNVRQSKDRRALLNIRAQIRRVAKEITE